MTILRRAAKAAIERVLRRDIRRLDDGVIALMPRKASRDAWFCYEVQLEHLLSARRVNLVVDVGANAGQFAQRVRRSYGGDIVSCEPLSEPFRRLAAAAASDPRWTVQQTALGSAPAQGRMNVAPYSPLSSFLTPNAFSRQQFRGSAGDAHEIVTVQRLDAVLEPWLRADPSARLFLKLDTQGYDLEAFEGLGAYAENVVVMQSEVSLIPIYDGMPHWTHSIGVYERAGFNVCGMFPVNRDAEGRVIEYDCLLVRSAAPERIVALGAR